MKKKLTIFVLYLIFLFTSHCVELKQIKEWMEYDGEKPHYYSTLCNDQILCEKYGKLMLINYLTNEVTYIFSQNEKLWYEGKCYINDQQGKYVFFQDGNKIKLFDVETHNFWKSGELLKREKFIYYLSCDNNENRYRLYRYDILSEEKLELQSENGNMFQKLVETTDDLNYIESYIKEQDIEIYNADFQFLFLRVDSKFYKIKLNETKTQITNIEQIYFDDYQNFDKIVRINNDYLFAFKIEYNQFYLECIEYKFMILDTQGRVICYFPDIELLREKSDMDSYLINNVCMISKDKEYILLFDEFKMFIYQFIK